MDTKQGRAQPLPPPRRKKSYKAESKENSVERTPPRVVPYARHKKNVDSSTVEEDEKDISTTSEQPTVLTDGGDGSVNHVPHNQVERKPLKSPPTQPPPKPVLKPPLTQCPPKPPPTQPPPKPPSKSPPTQPPPKPPPTQAPPTQAQPLVSQPETEPPSSQPSPKPLPRQQLSLPLPSQPAQLDPTPSQPAQLDPTPSQPAQLDPTPSQPAQLDPTPSQPAQLNPTPSQPAQLDPTPSQPDAVSPHPAVKPHPKPPPRYKKKTTEKVVDTVSQHRPHDTVDGRGEPVTNRHSNLKNGYSSIEESPLVPVTSVEETKKVKVPPAVSPKPKRLVCKANSEEMKASGKRNNTSDGRGNTCGEQMNTCVKRDDTNTERTQKSDERTVGSDEVVNTNGERASASDEDINKSGERTSTSGEGGDSSGKSVITSSERMSTSGESSTSCERANTNSERANPDGESVVSTNTDDKELPALTSFQPAIPKSEHPPKTEHPPKLQLSSVPTFKPRRKAPLPPVKQAQEKNKQKPDPCPTAAQPPVARPSVAKKHTGLRRSNSLPRQRLPSDAQYQPISPQGSQSATLGRKFPVQLMGDGSPKNTDIPKTKKNFFSWLRKIGSHHSKHKGEGEAVSEKSKLSQSNSYHGNTLREVHAEPTPSDGYTEVEILPLKSRTLPKMDTPPDTEAQGYSTVEFIPNAKPRVRPMSSPQPLEKEQCDALKGPVEEGLYSTVDMARKAKNREIFEKSLTTDNRVHQKDSTHQASSDHEGDGDGYAEPEVVMRSLLKKNSKLRLSRTLSADSFNIDDFLVTKRKLDTTLMEDEGEDEGEVVGSAGDGGSGITAKKEDPVYADVDYSVSQTSPSQTSPSQTSPSQPSPSQPSPSQPSPSQLSPTQLSPALSPVQSPSTRRRLPPPVPLPYSLHKNSKDKPQEHHTSKDDQTMKSATLPAKAPLPGGPTASSSQTLPRIEVSRERRSSYSKQRGVVSPVEGNGPTIYLRAPLIDLSQSNSSEQDKENDEEFDTDWESEDDDYEEVVTEQGKDRPKTYHLAKEIMTTERTFVRRLTLLDVEFRGAIETFNESHDKQVVTEETIRQILSNVGSLRLLNSDFLDRLEERFRTWDSCPRIGDIMYNFGPFLRMYSEYISNFENGLKVLEETQKKNPAFAELVKEFEAQPQCANLSVANYMLETVQRIPRYKLLLQDYIKHLPEDSDDRDESQKALDCIAKVAQQVNESIRQVDNFKKLVEIEKKLIGDTEGLITPTRKLLKEGEVTKFSRKERTPRMLFLFNDILIYATTAQPPSFTSFKIIRRIPLLGMKVEDLDDPDVKHGFQIISTSKSFRLEASSEEEKNKWMKLSLEAIKEVQDQENSRRSIRKRQMSEKSMERTDGEEASLGEYAPPWLPDNCVSMCMTCTTNFTMTRRRHHCRACGNIFCADCSRFSACLQYCGNKFGRVCQACYDVFKRKGVRVRTGKPSMKKSSSSSTSLSHVLQEVKARDQSSDMSGYLHAKSGWGWKRRWFVLQNLALYAFEKHEDRAAKKSIIVPSHTLVYPHEDDPFQFCLRHPGTGANIFKGEDEDSVKRWVEALSMAVKGELGSPTVT